MTNTIGKLVLPTHPNPDYLRKQAKQRLADMKTRVPTARLADAQHVLAREYGFANWAALQAEAVRRAGVPRIRFRRLYVPSLLRFGGEGEDSDIQAAFFRAGVAAQIGFIFTALVGVSLLFVTHDQAQAAHAVLGRLHNIL